MAEIGGWCKQCEPWIPVGKFRDSPGSWEPPLALEPRAAQQGGRVARNKRGRVQGTPLWSFQGLGSLVL